ncbi:hypothetical protein J437_LFUL015117 [Ladona fulva]|uniref:Uncharacterized protein n=1 Tax=Ladona fulva TaxID=123851 RepID=A0A8K0P5Q3_LADFU|nr:hypothetical protein J437_LFUL015117 [Ladona fulva]
MASYGERKWARLGVTHEEARDLFSVGPDYTLAHCVSADLRICRGNTTVFKKYRDLGKLKYQNQEVGKVLALNKVFYLVTKQKAHWKPTYKAM